MQKDYMPQEIKPNISEQQTNLWAASLLKTEEVELKQLPFLNRHDGIITKET